MKTIFTFIITCITIINLCGQTTVKNNRQINAIKNNIRLDEFNPNATAGSKKDSLLLNQSLKTGFQIEAETSAKTKNEIITRPGKRTNLFKDNQEMENGK